MWLEEVSGRVGEGGHVLGTVLPGLSRTPLCLGGKAPSAIQGLPQ